MLKLRDSHKGLYCNILIFSYNIRIICCRINYCLINAEYKVYLILFCELFCIVPLSVSFVLDGQKLYSEHILELQSLVKYPSSHTQMSKPLQFPCPEQSLTPEHDTTIDSYCL